MAIRVVTERPTEPRRRRGVLIGTAVAVAAAVTIGAFWLGRSSSGAPSSPQTPSPSASTSSASSTPEATPSPTPTDPSAALMPNTGSVVDGLWRGTATVASGSSDAIYGIPIGWDRTYEGAVGAAMHTAAARYALPSLVEDTATELNSRLYTGDYLAELRTEEYVDWRARLRKGSRLSDAGVVLDAQGLPATQEKYYGGGIPEYGAYKVLDVESKDGALTSVDVIVFMPFYMGPGTDTDMTQVSLGFEGFSYVMVWDDQAKDWKASSWDTPADPADDLAAVKLEYSNQGYEWLREHLGSGWAVAADATEDPIPGAVKTR